MVWSHRRAGTQRWWQTHKSHCSYCMQTRCCLITALESSSGKLWRVFLHQIGAWTCDKHKGASKHTTNEGEMENGMRRNLKLFIRSCYVPSITISPPFLEYSRVPSMPNSNP